jgi:hypothetical protein
MQECMSMTAKKATGGYKGPERRSGEERRSEKERRSGKERRKKRGRKKINK